MVQRAVSTQRCEVCRWRTYSKAEMAEHTKDKHGRDVERQAPTFTTRAADQMEFKPALTKTQWGSELR
jgi:hypothetical protein